MLTESPHTPHRADPSRWVLALTILLGQITMAFSMFAVAVALPSIMHALNGNITTIHWVMTGFQIARTVPMPAMGWLSSLMGQRNLYMAGLLLTVLATICCGLAWNLESLIFFRVLQGIGAAPAQVTGMVILYEAFPAGQRGLVLGFCSWLVLWDRPSALRSVAIWSRNTPGARCFTSHCPPRCSVLF